MLIYHNFFRLATNSNSNFLLRSYCKGVDNARREAFGDGFGKGGDLTTLNGF